MQLTNFLITVLFGLSLAIPIVESDEAIENSLETRGDGPSDGWAPYSNYHSSGKSYPPKFHPHWKKCPAHRDVVPFLRTYVPSNFEVESPVIGFFFNWQERNLVPFFTLFNPWTKDYFYTADKWEKKKAIAHKGYQAQGVVGYIFPDASCGGVPVFRLYDPKGCKHFYTTSHKEKKKAMDCGWKFEGVAGYIYKSQW